MKKSVTTIRQLRLATVFSAVSIIATAQTAEQVTQIRKESNLKSLRSFGHQLKSKKVSTSALQAQAKKLNIPFSGESDGRLYQLRDIEKGTKLPIYYATYNRDASAGTRTEALNSSSKVFNLDGQDITLYEWDGGGVRTAHQEFGGRVIQKDTPAKLSDHATHVAGTLVASGVNSKAKGMAPKAKLNAYDWNNDLNEMLDAAADGALVSNHSYGLLGGYEYGNWSGNNGWHWFGADSDTEFRGYGKYSSTDRIWDLISKNAPYYLPVKAAGNPRGGGPEDGGSHYVYVNQNWTISNKTRQKNGGVEGFDSIINGSVGKNILVVGAVHKVKDMNIIEAASFSGFGPTDDGRVKPDIVGVGVDVYSTISSSNTSYKSSNGTSMASPNVTGSLGLLQQYYKDLNSKFMKSATLKALIFSTAKEAGNIGPDYKFGWGLLDAHKAAIAIATKGKYSIIEEKTLNNGTTEEISFVASGNKPIVATIVWDDPAPVQTAENTPLNDSTSMLVNDLDIKVVSDNGEVLPWKLNPRSPNSPAERGNNNVDNVEQVVIENPIAGKTYTLVISHKGNLKDNKIDENSIELVDASSQDYSVVVTGIDNGVEIDAELSALKINADRSEYSQQTPVSATIRNNGRQAISPTLKYNLVNKDDGTEGSPSTLSVPEIQPGAEATVSFNVDLSRSFVNYSINAEVIASNDSVEVNNQNSITTFGTVVDLTKKDSSHFFGFENDFDTFGWSSEDVNGDGKTWRKYNDVTLSNSGENFALNLPRETGTNDWLYSNPLKMKAGRKYRVIFYTSKLRDNEETLDVAFGKTPNSSAMTNIIRENITATTSYVRHVYTFVPTEDDVYYVGFRHHDRPTSLSFAILLDDVTIDQSEKPLVNFTSSKRSVDSFEEVTLTADVYTEPSSSNLQYQWTFSPNDVTYKDGTNANSPNPKVLLNAQGRYTVSLTATDSNGMGTITKEDYITVSNVRLGAAFSVSPSTKVYKGTSLTFRDLSIGKPAANRWNWSISPSAGWEFLEGDSSKERVVVKFNEAGEYNVTLTASSPYNDSHSTRKINILPLNPVRNLKGNGDTSNKRATLTWSRPEIESSYFEGFEDRYRISVLIDEDSDRRNWMLSKDPKYAKTGNGSAVSLSYDDKEGSLNVRNWIVTSLIPKGAEVLSFWVKHDRPELYDVYILRDEDKKYSFPNFFDIMESGAKIYDYTSGTPRGTYTNVSIDLKEFANSDIYVAFRHKTPKEQNGLYLALDDIEVGYKNDIPKEEQVSATEAVEVENKLSLDKYYVFTKNYMKEGLFQEFDQSAFDTSASTIPVKGYKVFRDNVEVANIPDANTTSFSETVTDNRVYKYDVLATYATGVSEKETVEVDLSLLGVNNDSLQSKMEVYPNPSSGPFSIKAPKGNKIIGLQVFDMSGKSILKTSPNSEVYSFDLSKNGKGIYILSTTDSEGKTVNLKIMVK